MPSVTIQSSQSGDFVRVPFASSQNFLLANEIAALISSGVADGSLKPALSSDGPPPTLRHGREGVFFEESTQRTVLPKGYVDVVNISKNASIVGSGAKHELIISGNGGLNFYAVAGSGTLAAGGGKNDITISRNDPGSWLIATGDGADTIHALGKGNDTISPGGGKNFVVLGAGHDTVLLTGQDTVVAASGHDSIDASGAKSTLIFGGSAHITFVGGAGPATILGGTGSETVTGGTGKLVVRGGTHGHNILYAGTGAATLYGGGKGDMLFAEGSKSQVLLAGAGNETLSAAMSSGHDTLVGGTGRATLIGGSGKDTFSFVKGHGGGHDLVVDFASPDKIALTGFGSHAVTDALATQQDHHGSVTITLSDDTRITFSGVSSLSKSDFT